MVSTATNISEEHTKNGQGVKVKNSIKSSILSPTKARGEVDLYPIIPYTLVMKDKKVTIKARHISSKQWSVFLLELNLIKKAWESVGVDIQLITPQLKKVLAWGTRKHDEPYEPTYKEK